MKFPVKLLIVFTFLLVVSNLNAQTFKASTNDTVKSKILLKKSIVPVSLIGLGIIVNNSSFEKKFQTNLRNKVGNNYELRIDDYLQYAPIVELYSADLLGIKSKNHWFDQTKYLLIANLISSTLTHSLKKIKKKE